MAWCELAERDRMARLAEHLTVARLAQAADVKIMQQYLEQLVRESR